MKKNKGLVSRADLKWRWPIRQYVLVAMSLSFLIAMLYSGSINLLGQEKNRQQPGQPGKTRAREVSSLVKKKPVACIKSGLSCGPERPFPSIVLNDCQ